MRVNIQSRSTNRFIDLWCYIAVAITGVLYAILIVSWFLGNLLVSANVLVDADEPETFQPIQVKPDMGALSIDVNATLPSNRWVTYEIQLRDQQDQVLASAIKNAWAESGTWQEDGESGTWQEQDLLAALDIKATKPETITVTLEVLDYTNTAGQEIDEAVPFQVRVRTGTVDSRYLWAGFIGAVGLTILALTSVRSTGDRVIFSRKPDSDVGDRGVVGGPNRLVRVTVTTKSDETSPRQLTVKLFVKDGDGEQIYARDFPVKVRLSKDKQGHPTGGTANLCTFFILEPRGSYGFYAEVVPDGPIDETRLTVREKAKTLGKVNIIHLRAV